MSELIINNQYTVFYKRENGRYLTELHDSTNSIEYTEVLTRCELFDLVDNPGEIHNYYELI